MRRFAACVFACVALLSPVAAAGDGYEPTTNSPLLTCYMKGDLSTDTFSTRVNMGALSATGTAAAGYGGGVQFGCDVSSSWWLAGVFADYELKQASFTATAAGLPVMHFGFRDEASAGLRFGALASTKSVVYGLVAYTWSGGEDATMGAMSLGLQGPRGVTLGGGIEVALTRHIVSSVEYRHTWFESQTSTVLAGSRFGTDEDVVRAGLGYRF